MPSKAIDFLSEGGLNDDKQTQQQQRERERDHQDESAFIAAALTKANKKASSDVAKMSTKGKGKNKTQSGLVTGGGSFQSMGLHPSLLRSLLIRGFTTPTPIQRLSIPHILSQPPRDIVGMARTGSGKTLAYMIPLIQRLNGRHSSSMGVKALVLCPSRELALQILRVGKEVARGWKADGVEGDAEGAAKPEPIRWGLIVGGESLDEQFALMASNPDVLIATPGRLLHLAVEMNLSLSAAHYVVFDEADRLFEMGFAVQLEELLTRLPANRQTLLFSATLPKTIVEFARAGLQPNPKLIRLDADSKISTDLKMTFLSVKPTEKEAALLILLRDVIGVPYGQQGPAEEEETAVDEGWGKGGLGKGRGVGSAKRKRSTYGPLTGTDELKPWQTIVFCATKHHVEYLIVLLSTAGYSCSHIYSSLDQSARTYQMSQFRSGKSSLLIVTDVAARGIDLPVLTHVVNYDFSPQPRLFVHRVGRTARAGKKGWAWNFVTNKELPLLCELQLFLARPLKPAYISLGASASAPPLDLHSALTLGTFPRSALDVEVEYVTHNLPSASSSIGVALPALREVVTRAQDKYEKSQTRPSKESYRRAKEMTLASAEGILRWRLAGSEREQEGVHDVVGRPRLYGLTPVGTEEGKQDDATTSAKADEERARAALMAKVNSFRPAKGETVFELGSKGRESEGAKVMSARRRTLDGRIAKGQAAKAAQDDSEEDANLLDDAESDEGGALEGTQLVAADEDDIEAVFGKSRKRPRDSGAYDSDGQESHAPNRKAKSTNFKDPDFYMDYAQKGAHDEKGYSLAASDFITQANSAALSMQDDEGGGAMGTSRQRPNTTRWDTKKKKFVRTGQVGQDNAKMIRTEGGRRLPASFRSGRFDAWAKENKVDIARIGEQEAALPRGLAGSGRGGRGGGRGGRGGFRHTRMDAPKRVDPKSDKWDKMKKQQRGAGGRDSEGGESSGRGGRGGAGNARGGRGGARGARQPTNKAGRTRTELKSALDIQKSRALKEKRREKNARPSSKKGKGKSSRRGGGRG